MGINTPKNNRIQQTAGDHTWVQHHFLAVSACDFG